jgi:serine/threonine protein kinase
MKKIIINPEYEFLRKYIEDIPENFDSIGTVMESKRNIIREDSIQGTRVVIKSFRRIYLTNRIHYSFFYPSKAERAFDHAMILRHNGFNTAMPIAYIEVTRYGLINQSFFISEYLDYQPLNKVSDWESFMESELILELARYTLRLHLNNIYHKDYSLGNILFKKIDNKYQFALVDNNRMSFGPVSVEKGIRNLVKLGLPIEHLTRLAKEYARLRKVDELMSLERLFHYKRSELDKRQMKQSLKGMMAALKSYGYPR